MIRARMLAVIAGATLVLAGCGGDDGDASDAGADAAVDIETAAVEIQAGDLYFDPEELSTAAGEVDITLDNVGAAVHDLVIEEADDAEVVQAGPGETASGTIELEAGTYTYYCSVPGHRSTMEGTLEVV